MNKKIGVNDLCLCGSGNKYKKCGLIGKCRKFERWEIDKEIKETFDKKYCSVPKNLKVECRDIIKAHTISRSQNLQKIAKNQHVYSIAPTFLKIDRNEGILKPELIGINKASTFTGFCSYHDSALFAPLEIKPFTGSEEQCFLLAYRTIAREYYTKTSSVYHISQKNCQGVTPRLQPFIEDYAKDFELGRVSGEKKISQTQQEYDQILNSKNYSNLKTFIFFFSKIPSVMCSGAIFPECDFQGQKLFDLSDLSNNTDILAFSSIATDNGGAVVFCWIQKHNDYCEKFISSLMQIPPQDVTSAIIKFIFEFCENICFSPLWWDTLCDNKKNELINHMNSGIINNRDMDCLCKTNTAFDDWQLSNTI
jgi:hypothetical protein